MDTIARFGLLAIFLVAILTLPVLIFRASWRGRFTMQTLFVMLTVVCLLAAFFGSALHASRRNAIRNLEMKRKRYQSWRQDMSPAEYQRVMDELDARAERLGVGK